MDLDYVAEYDKLKTKVLKYIVYKKRTKIIVRFVFITFVRNDTNDTT